ncbi:MAG: Fe-S cluster assembly protein SufD, partial [Proteobacteria bacterium]|nr:Fe-S cluster assembly protein SufD [Pseudomonadota bacterium]
ITADKASRIRHYRVQAQGEGSVHVNTIRARVSADAAYESFILAVGGSVARDEVHVGLVEARASTNLNGVYLGTGNQVIDSTTVIRHDAPDTVSNELYKGVLDGSARAVFQGNIRVEKGADGSDGRLSNRTMLLSDDSEIDTKPQLEIYADEVQCAHGATAGQLDETALFYLRSRGIAEDAARHMLVEAFLGEVVDGVEDETLSELLRARIADWLKVAQISAGTPR